MIRFYISRTFAAERNRNLERGVRVEKESRWVHCPLCDGKTRIKVYEDTVLLNFPLYCPKCKKEIMVNVVKLKMVHSKEPDA